MDIGSRALKRLGKRIAMLRREHGYSQEAFAYEVDLARSYVSGVERGVRNLSFKTVARIAKTLGISIAELCDGV
jgi:transcriptional regulator with XRE-family HTH domain